MVYQLTFTREMFHAPLLDTISKKFEVSMTLRRAMLSEEGGWVEVGLEGELTEVGRAIAYLQTTGVNTSGPLDEKDLVEPNFKNTLNVVVGRGT
jgi:NIL domain